MQSVQEFLHSPFPDYAHTYGTSQEIIHRNKESPHTVESIKQSFNKEKLQTMWWFEHASHYLCGLFAYILAAGLIQFVDVRIFTLITPLRE